MQFKFDISNKTFNYNFVKKIYQYKGYYIGKFINFYLEEKVLIKNWLNIFLWTGYVSNT